MKTKYEVAFSGKGNVSEVMLQIWPTIQAAARKHHLDLAGPAVDKLNLSLIFHNDVSVEGTNALMAFQEEVMPLMATTALENNLTIASTAYGQMYGDTLMCDSVPLRKLLPEDSLKEDTRFREHLKANRETGQKNPTTWERN